MANSGGGKVGIAAVAITMLAAGMHGSHSGGGVAQLLSDASTAVQSAIPDGGSHNLGTRRGWARAFLSAIPEPVTRCNVKAVVAWEHAEGGGFGNQAENNPLNVNPPAGTGWPGYHAIGAWAFPDPQTGLDYTVQTIRNGNYQPVLGALSAGDDAQAVENAIMASPWAGSHYNGALTATC